jgi:hypothetical protein
MARPAHRQRVGQIDGHLRARIGSDCYISDGHSFDVHSFDVHSFDVLCLDRPYPSIIRCVVSRVGS